MLGFDDPHSTDHFWGPLLHVFLLEDDNARRSAHINRALAEELPFEVRGFLTNFRPFEGDEATSATSATSATCIQPPHIPSTTG